MNTSPIAGPNLQPLGHTRRLSLRRWLQPNLLAAGAVAILPVGAGVGTALGAGDAVGAATGAVGAAAGHAASIATGGSHGSSGSSGSSATSSGSSHGPSGPGSPATSTTSSGSSHAGGAGKSSDNSSGADLSVVSNNKTNRVWVVSTDKKTGGMSVVGSAVVNATSNTAGTAPNAPGTTSNTTGTGSKTAGTATNTVNGTVPNTAQAQSYVVKKTDNAVSVVDSTTNKVVATLPVNNGASAQSFSAPGSLPASQPPAHIVGQPNGASH